MGFDTQELLANSAGGFPITDDALFQLAGLIGGSIAGLVVLVWLFRVVMRRSRMPSTPATAPRSVRRQRVELMLLIAGWLTTLYIGAGGIVGTVWGQDDLPLLMLAAFPFLLVAMARFTRRALHERRNRTSR